MKALNWQKNNKNILKRKKYKTLKERIALYKKLPKENKGSVIDYDWGEDLGKERFY